MVLFALTVLVSSFLLFLVQPIIAKQIVPWFGGSAAVWTTCLAFFQMVLLAGYAYSDVVQRLKPKAQSMLHLALLVISLLALPIVAGDHWKPTGEEDPFWRILGLLFVTIGLPYFMLSTTGPLIQSWFAREQKDPAVARRAYRLFALSNFGSLMGLLAYPFVIEPWVSTQLQATIWSAFYGLFVLLTGAVALRAMRHPAAMLTHGATPSDTTEFSAEEVHGVKPVIADLMLWFSLSGLATILLLSISSHITQNVASIPFLWVVPLSLYLLTFVVAFEGRGGRGWYLRETMMLPALLLAGFMAWGLVTDHGILDIDIAIPLYLAGLFLACLFCHGELAAAKPHPRFLTRFYFVIALGGAAGGVFVSLIAPRVFSSYWELPLALMLIGFLGIWVALRQGKGPLQKVFVGGSLVSLVVCGYYAGAYQRESASGSIYASRNFYGTLKITDREYPGGIEPVRRLIHGVILHGLQDLNLDYRHEATTYYGESSGVGIAIRHYANAQPNGIRVGVIGLGVGTLARYGRRGDYYRMYEINPTVIDVAQSYFSYIKDSQATVSFAQGDARLVLEREPAQQFDLLVIDAFSSDSIPIHLMTREALSVYRRHLSPNGVIVFHVTNRYLDLAPVVQQLANQAGLSAALVSDDPVVDPRGTLALSDWVLVTNNTGLLANPEVVMKRHRVNPIPGLSPWTDDFNNLFRVLK